jgi:PAS domain S-box-containing protein
MFNNMKIGLRLVLSFGVMGVLIIAVVIAALVDLDRMGNDFRTMVEIERPRQQAANNMVIDTREVSITLRNMMIESDHTKYAGIKQKIDGLRKDYDTNFEKVQKSVSKDETGMLDQIAKIKTIQDVSRAANNKVIELIMAEKADDAVVLLNSDAGPKVSEWVTSVDDLIYLMEGATTLLYEESVKDAESMRTTMYIIGAFALLLAFIIAFFLTRSITGPVRATTDLIVSRDLTVDRSAYINGKNELAYMLRTFIKDISERTKMEEDMLAASVYARNLIESSLDPLVTISPEGKITDVNESTVKVTGVARDRLVGTDFSDYFTEPARAKEGYQMVFKQGYVRDYPLTLRNSSGQLTNVLYNASVYKDEAGKVKGVFAAARDVTEKVKISEELRKHRENLEETINVLSSSTTEIMATASQLASSSSETATAVGETTTTIEEVKHTVQVSNDKAKLVSSSAQKTVQVSIEGKKATEQTIEGMNRIRSQMDTIAETVVKLSEQSQSIGEIVASVSDIAEQSNLLAVNASIEAARAGEQGKGFAVVAQEIKSLAEQSKQATAQVRVILTDVQKSINSAVMVTEQGNKAVDAGASQAATAEKAIRELANSVNEAAQMAIQIAASSQEQMVGMDQVALAMDNINQASSQNAASVKQIEITVQTLHEMGQKLKQLVEKFRE